MKDFHRSCGGCKAPLFTPSWVTFNLRQFGEKVSLDSPQPFLYTRRRFHPGTIYDHRGGHRYHVVILAKT